MRYKVLILAEAEHDLDAAFVFYELRQLGLGKRFFQSVDESVKFLSEDPLIFAEIYNGLRRILIRKFPYGIYYRVILETKRIQIVGVIHFGRDLKILRKRV